jgi:hypothetical protein
LTSKISRSGAAEILNRQLEHYHHIRKQSLAVLRILIALASLAILSLTTETVQNYLDNFSLIPQYLQSSSPLVLDVFLALLNVIIILPMIMVSGFAFLMAIYNLMQIYFSESLFPALGSQSPVIVVDNDDRNSDKNYITWVVKNNVILRQVVESFKVGLALMGVSLFYLFVIFISLIGVQNQTQSLLLMVVGLFQIITFFLWLFAIPYLVRQLSAVFNTGGETPDYDWENLFYSILAVDRKPPHGSIHLFVIFLIAMHTFSSVFTIWMFYDWWQVV